MKCSLEQCRCPFNNILPKFREETEAKECIEKYMKTMYSKFLSDIYIQLNDYIKNLKSNKFNLLLKIKDNLSWLIPIKKWRDKFRSKFL